MNKTRLRLILKTKFLFVTKYLSSSILTIFYFNWKEIRPVKDDHNVKKMQNKMLELRYYLGRFNNIFNKKDLLQNSQ